MPVGLLTLHLQIPGCTSLKEKRGRLKPLMTRLHRQFNVSVAEMDHQDAWQESLIACALVNHSEKLTRNNLQAIHQWIENYWPDVLVIQEWIEIY